MAKNKEENKAPDSPLFMSLSKRIRELNDGIEQYETKQYTGYKLNINFAEVQVQKKRIKISLLGRINYKDSKGMIRQETNTCTRTLNKYVYLESADELDDVMALIRQSYRSVL